eukprot:299509-Hanusia_phi.AAC.2
MGRGEGLTARGRERKKKKDVEQELGAVRNDLQSLRTERETLLKEREEMKEQRRKEEEVALLRGKLVLVLLLAVTGVIQRAAIMTEFIEELKEMVQDVESEVAESRAYHKDVSERLKQLEQVVEEQTRTSERWQREVEGVMLIKDREFQEMQAKQTRELNLAREEIEIQNLHQLSMSEVIVACELRCREINHELQQLSTRTRAEREAWQQSAMMFTRSVLPQLLRTVEDCVGAGLREVEEEQERERERQREFLLSCSRGQEQVAVLLLEVVEDVNGLERMVDEIAAENRDKLRRNREVVQRAKSVGEYLLRFSGEMIHLQTEAEDIRREICSMQQTQVQLACRAAELERDLSAGVEIIRSQEEDKQQLQGETESLREIVMRMDQNYRELYEAANRKLDEHEDEKGEIFRMLQQMHVALEVQEKTLGDIARLLLAHEQSRRDEQTICCLHKALALEEARRREEGHALRSLCSEWELAFLSSERVCDLVAESLEQLVCKKHIEQQKSKLEETARRAGHDRKRKVQETRMREVCLLFAHKRADVHLLTFFFASWKEDVPRRIRKRAQECMRARTRSGMLRRTFQSMSSSTRRRRIRRRILERLEKTRADRTKQLDKKMVMQTPLLDLVLLLQSKQRGGGGDTDRGELLAGRRTEKDASRKSQTENDRTAVPPRAGGSDDLAYGGNEAIAGGAKDSGEMRGADQEVLLGEDAGSRKAGRQDLPPPPPAPAPAGPPALARPCRLLPMGLLSSREDDASPQSCQDMSPVGDVHVAGSRLRHVPTAGWRERERRAGV